MKKRPANCFVGRLDYQGKEPRGLVAFAATAAAEATTTAAAAATAATAATTTAATTFFAGTSFVDRELPTINFFAVQAVDSCGRFIAVAHLDKAEAFRAPRVAIHDDLSRLNRAERREHRLKVGIGHTIRQITYVQLASHDGPPAGTCTQPNQTHSGLVVVA